MNHVTLPAKLQLWNCRPPILNNTFRAPLEKALSNGSAYNMLFEDQRFIHEDLERLEQAVADRVAEEPRNVSGSSL